jgi:hypothetical protein
MSDAKNPRNHSELKQQRLAAALRENLKRRKVQARGQSSPSDPKQNPNQQENSQKTEKN